MVKLIAYYLPQYHPIKENDEWWGTGFTEWTNVSKAKPLFRGHIQPNIPADLGFYDLRLEESRCAQANLAKSYGIYGFCYWHYWFGNGKQLLERPIQEVLLSGKPDFPFCLGWANESWFAKTWNSDGTTTGKMLIEQTYPGAKDIEDHFYNILPLIKDNRYIKYKNNPIFLIYRPLLMPDFTTFKNIWNNLLRKETDYDSFHFIAHSTSDEEVSAILEMGYDAINMVKIGAYRWNKRCIREHWWKLFKYKFLNQPLRLEYAKMLKYFVGNIEKGKNIYPSIIPNWDHTPRSGRKGVVLEGVTPKLFERHICDVLSKVSEKDADDRLIFLKSWNEWGEGNYMEPDIRNGHNYLEVLRRCLIK